MRKNHEIILSVKCVCKLIKKILIKCLMYKNIFEEGYLHLAGILFHRASILFNYVKSNV